MTFYDNLTERDLLLSAWQALRRIEQAIAARNELPAPQVTVTPPDLTDIVTAVQGLGGTPGPSADDIARAIADVIAPARPDDGGEALRQVAEGLKLLDHRLQGFGKQAYGGGSVSLSPNQSISVANQLIPSAYDEIVLTYSGDDVTSVVYKQGAATVATLTLTYTGTNVTRVVRT